MKIIFDTDLLTDNVTSCVASSEDADFPDENLRDNFTTNLWRAASGLTAIITLLVSKGKSVALFNTNATSAVVTAGSGDSFEPEAGYVYEAGYVDADDEVATIAVSDLSGVKGLLWADYTQMLTPHVVKIALTAAAAPYAGIVRAGIVQEFRDPAPNHGEGSIDYSVEMELNNGANYFRKRNVVRTFEDLKIFETRPNAWKFKHDIFDAVGPQPLAIRLIQNANVTDDEFVVFAKRIDPPELEHTTNTFSTISFNLKEVI